MLLAYDQQTAYQITPGDSNVGDGEVTLNLECPWRLLLNGAIAFGGDDDGQQFGLSAPLDVVKETEKLLSASLVSLVEIREGCSDLSLTFQNGVRLEAFNGSSGYEGWTCSGKGGVTVVAQGGGNLSMDYGRYPSSCRSESELAGFDRMERSKPAKPE